MFTKAHPSVARPRRGNPEDTRRRLVHAAAETFNTHGYSGTDVRRIVDAAGYATGTFYKHFTDKDDVLVAAFEAWVAEEWEALGQAITAADDPATRAERIVAISIEQHARWHGLRQAMAGLRMTNERAARAHVELQRHQVAILANLRATISPHSTRPPEADVLLVMLIERTVEGMACDEPAHLGLDADLMRRMLVSAVADALEDGG